MFIGVARITILVAGVACQRSAGFEVNIFLCAIQDFVPGSSSERVDRLHIFATLLALACICEGKHTEGFLPCRLVHNLAETFGRILASVCIVLDSFDTDMPISPEHQCTFKLYQIRN